MCIKGVPQKCIHFSMVNNYGFQCCSTHDEDLSFDVSITNVGLILIDEAKVISGRQHKSKFNFELFWKKKSNF